MDATLREQLISIASANAFRCKHATSDIEKRLAVARSVTCFMNGNFAADEISFLNAPLSSVPYGQVGAVEKALETANTEHDAGEKLLKLLQRSCEIEARDADLANNPEASAPGLSHLTSLPTVSDPGG